MNIMPTHISITIKYGRHELFLNYYEYEQGQADIIVKSRLKKHYNFWKNIGCYDYILDTIYNGYRIPCFSTPPSICLSNNRSAVNHSELSSKQYTIYLLKV